MIKRIRALLLMVPLITLCGWAFWVLWYQAKDVGGREFLMFFAAGATLGLALIGAIWLFGRGWRLLISKENKVYVR